MTEPFNVRLKKILEKKGMLQKALAEKSGVTESSVSHYIKGDRTPNAETLTRLATALGTTPDYILFGEPSTMDERLSDAADMVVKCATYLTHEQKMGIIESIIQ